MNPVCRRFTSQSSLLGLALHRSFSRSSMGLKFPQITLRLGVTPEEKQRPTGNPSNGAERSWVNAVCVCVAALGLGFSFFSTRRLCDDPNRQIFWKK